MNTFVGKSNIGLIGAAALLMPDAKALAKGEIISANAFMPTFGNISNLNAFVSGQRTR